MRYLCLIPKFQNTGIVKKVIATHLASIFAVFALLSPGGLLAQTAPSGQSREVSLEGKNAFSRGAPIPVWADKMEPIPRAVDQAPVTMRLAETTFYVDQEPAYFVHRALQVNEASSLGQIGQSEIAFQVDYQRVQLHVLRIHRGSQVIDKLADADIRFLRREPELDSGVYAGSITAAIVINDVRVGDTLEVAYTVTGKNPVFGNRFADAASWDGVYPTLRRRVTVNAPRDRTVGHRFIGVQQRSAPQAVVSTAGNRQLTRFDESNIPAVDLEPYMPRDYQPMRWIQFSEFGSWSEVNQWAQGLFSPPTKPEALRDALASARKEKTTALAVAKALEFVQRDIRYLSVSLGENSHRPYPPELVLQRRYGDCKDKSLLLVSMLRQLGVEAAPVLVSTYQRKGLETMLPSPLLFDHVIVRVVVDGKTHFLDPTRQGQVGALETMGQVHGDSQVLVIAPGSNQLVEIPATENEALITDSRIERVTITKMDEPALMSVQLMYRGVMAESMRNGISQITLAQLRKFYEGNIGKRYPNATLMGDPIVVDTKNQNSLTVELQFRIKDFLQVSDGDWLLQYQSPNLQDQFFAPGNTNRNTPLSIPSYRSIHRYQLELTLPDEFDARYNPSQRAVENPAFVFSKTLSFKGRTLGAAMDLHVRADRVLAKEVPVFLTDLNKVADLMQGTLYIRKSDLRSANAGAAVSLPLKQQVVDRLEQIIKSSSRVATQAKADGRDQSAALCERAKAAAYLGRYPDALADAQNAVRQKPNDAEALTCRAEVASTAGEFKSSEQDYSRAMALGASSEDLYLQRGIVTFYQGKFSLAKEDFAKVVSLSNVASEKLRADIWRILALRRTGLTPNAEKTSTVQDEEWPSVVPAFFLNQNAPETVLRAAHKSSGDRLDWHLTEAYFYLGQHYLLADDKTKARLYFQHAIDKGVLYSAYYNAARHELARLR